MAGADEGGGGGGGKMAGTGDLEAAVLFSA